MAGNAEPTLAEVRAAAQRIAPHVHRTPVMTCSALDQAAGAELFFKCENLQKVGAFKIRGATNAVLQLNDAELARGVASHSSGNHAAALSLAARNVGIPAYIVMPDNAPAIKRTAVAGYGGQIVPCAANLAAREDTLLAVLERTGAHFVPPYDDNRVIAGQGSCGLEFCEQVDDLQALVVPVGGGGLLAGCAIAAKALRPEIELVGAEPQRADDAYRSLAAGRIILPENGQPDTIADGLRTALGERTFPVIRRLVDRIVPVSEQAIVAAMRQIWERMKLVVEPSAAVVLAAVLAAPETFRGRRVGLVLSGGNVDLERLPWQS